MTENCRAPARSTRAAEFHLASSIYPMSLTALRRTIRSLGNPARAEVSQRYFKTGKGEYGEGDRFLGLDAATMHSLAKQYRDTPLATVGQLLHSQWHEERLVALLILVRPFEKGHGAALLALSLANTSRLSNWDPVAPSPPHIHGRS